jgi:hypothetical protein
MLRFIDSALNLACSAVGGIQSAALSLRPGPRAAAVMRAAQLAQLNLLSLQHDANAIPAARKVLDDVT